MGKLDGWVEIFRAGKHTDSQGRTREFSVADLDRMVGSYQPEQHEAPAVIGHPKDNAPAWGWVDGLKRVGEVALAKFKDVQPEFADMVDRRLFKKRSISLYPDGSLRHVGFLGAQPPAIKGLRDFAIGSEEECSVYEFAEAAADSKSAIRNQQSKKEGDMPKTVEELQAQLAKETEARTQAEARAKTAEEQAAKAVNDFAESEKKSKRAELVAFVDQGIKDAKMLPIWKDQGIVEFMQALEGGEVQTFEFAEGKKESPAAWFKTFISSFSEHPLFKEMTSPKDDKDKSGEFAESEDLTKYV
jgi:hypothetical protein